MPFIKYTDSLGDFLEENQVYFTYNKRKRFKEGDMLRYPANLRIEKHCIYVVGNTLNTMGLCSFSRSRLTERTTVGRYSSIAPNLKIMGFQHPIDRFSTSPITYSTHPSTVNVPLAAGTEEGNFQAIPYKQKVDAITIGNDVWIGEDVTCKPGITIGDGAVVATGAIVTKDVPPFAIVGGVPAKVLSYRFRQSVIDELLALNWWDYCYWTFDGVRAGDGIEYFIDQLQNLKAKNKLKRVSDLSFVSSKDIEKYV